MDDRLLEFESNFSVLDRYGVDVTAEAFYTNPAIGRDNQIKELMLILLTPEKSAILIGKPGIGKTAIVEGLAFRMQKGDVPDALKGYTIINIKTASLLGTMPSGESKVQKMIDELKLREKVILFVDEIHMLIGATDSSSLDFANIFKEGLGRGSIKVIGATTTEEYERYILRDKAFTRRFQKVEVPEPTREETIQIMMGTYPKFEKQTGRKLKYTRFIQERLMSFLVDITSEYKRVFALGSRYPDVCLTLLKQAFSYTVFDNREYVDIFDIRKAIENSKNIYPDVIKKELPRFDKEFNDILLEEKGEKPIEEWRREVGPTRFEQMNNNAANNGNGSSIFMTPTANNKQNNNIDNNPFFKSLEKGPTMVDKQTLKENRPVKGIMKNENMQRFAKIGPTAISKGMKEKFNRKSDSSNIDNLLLSSEIGVISENKSGTNIPFKYTVTDELKPGGTTDLLLGRPISSTTDGNKPQEIVVETYKSDNMLEKELDPNKNSLMLSSDVKNDRQRFNSNFRNESSFEEALNFGGFQQSNDNNMNNKNNRNDRGNRDSRVNNSNNRNQNINKDFLWDNNAGNDTSESSNGGFSAYNQNNQNNQNNFYGTQFNSSFVNNSVNPNGEFSVNLSQDRNRNYNTNNISYDNNSNQVFGGSNNNNSETFNPMISNTGNLSSVSRDSFLGEFSNNHGETLFGAPMYSNDVTNKKEQSNVQMFLTNDTNLQNNNSFSNTINNGEALFGAPMYSNDVTNNSLSGNDFYNTNSFNNNNSNVNNGETLFGAPMYSNDVTNKKEQSNVQMYLTNNSLSGNDFYNTNSFNNNNSNVNTGETLFGAPMYSSNNSNSPFELPENKGVDIFGQLITNNMRIKDGQIVDDFSGLDQYGIKSTSVIGEVTNVTPNNVNNNYVNFNSNNSTSFNDKWKFVDENPIKQKNTSFNELNLSNNLQFNNINNNVSPSNGFVNFNDLNSGKIPQNEVNQFISLTKPANGMEQNRNVSPSTRAPLVDLNLESNNAFDTEEYFDDFFDN